MAMLMLKIDPSWTRILTEYPKSSLFKKHNKRTGKAKNCLFEEIDKNLYENEAKMITFHTNLQRIHPWIKTIDVFYYNFLGENEDFKINWYDDPEVWESGSDSSNSMVMEVMQKTNLLYSVTFFVTTGTFRVQGSNYRLFADIHFSILKQILDKVLALQIDERESSGEDDPHSSSIVYPVMTEDDTAVKTLNVTDTVGDFQRLV